MRRLAPLAAVFVVAGAALLPGLALADDSVSIRSVELGDFPVVGLTISTAGQGSLGRGDVRIEENGVPARVVGVEPLGTSGGLVDAVLAIDVSNSMRGAELETALAAAQTFVDGVPASLPVGLISFAAQPVVRSPITVDRLSVEDSLAAVGAKTSAGTALYQAVVVGASMFEPGNAVQHNVVLLTDGKNTVTSVELDQAVAAARDRGVNVFTISLEGSDADEATLSALAARTGGRFTSISTDDLEAVYAGLARQLGQQFVISYRSKAPLGAPVSLTVSLPDGSASTRFLTPGVSSSIGHAQASGVGDEAASPVTSEAAIAVIAGLVFLAVLNLILLLVAAVERRRRDAALRSRMLVDALDEPADPVTPSNPTFIPSGVSDAAERAAGSGMTAKLARRLHQAGWSIRVGEFLSIVVSAGIVAAVGGYLLLGPVGTLLGVAAAIAPFVVLSAAATKRLAAIQAQLADTLMVIASSLRAGHSFLQSLDTVTKEIGEPGASEFGRTMSEIRIGRTVDDALDGLVERVGSRDLEWAITAIKIQRRIGGNLAEILEGVANTIRERETLRRQVKVLSAEGRISAVVLTVLPIFIAAYLMRINPDYLRVLTTTRLGIILISSAAGLMLIGYIWMKRIVRIDDV